MEGGDKEKLDGFGGVTREVFPPPPMTKLASATEANPIIQFLNRGSP